MNDTILGCSADCVPAREATDEAAKGDDRLLPTQAMPMAHTHARTPSSQTPRAAPGARRPARRAQRPARDDGARHATSRTPRARATQGGVGGWRAGGRWPAGSYHPRDHPQSCPSTCAHSWAARRRRARRVAAGSGGEGRPLRLRAACLALAAPPARRGGAARARGARSVGRPARLCAFPAPAPPTSAPSAVPHREWPPYNAPRR